MRGYKILPLSQPSPKKLPSGGKYKSVVRLLQLEVEKKVDPLTPFFSPGRSAVLPPERHRLRLHPMAP